MVDEELQELLADFLLECDERLATVETSLLELAKPTANDKPALLELAIDAEAITPKESLSQIRESARALSEQS